MSTARSDSSARGVTSIGPIRCSSRDRRPDRQTALEREHAVTVNAAEWVTKNYDDQIATFKKIAAAMKALVEALPTNSGLPSMKLVPCCAAPGRHAPTCR